MKFRGEKIEKVIPNLIFKTVQVILKAYTFFDFYRIFSSKTIQLSGLFTTVLPDI